MFYEHLDLDQRNRILDTMNEEQREFMESNLRRGRKTTFANALVMKKEETFKLFDESEEIEEHSDWVLLDYIDAGAVSEDLLCECGKKLRYQYIVKNVKSDQILKFGSTHFEEHTGIPANIVKLVIKGVQMIDYEMDEILNKFDNGYDIKSFKLAELPKELIPKDIIRQMDLNLPLLERQEKRFYHIYNEYLKQKYKNLMNELNVRRAKELQKKLQGDISLKSLPLDSKDELVEEPLLLDSAVCDDNDLTMSRKMIKRSESTTLYKNHLLEDCKVMIKNGLNSVNLIVEELLKLQEYEALFKGFTQRMCYRIVVTLLVDEKMRNDNLIGKGLPDRSDAYFYMK